MKIIEKEDLNTTFDKIKFGECFKVKGISGYFMKTPLTVSPVTDRELNCVDLSIGCFDCFNADQEVTEIDCELIVK